VDVLPARPGSLWANEQIRSTESAPARRHLIVIGDQLG